MAENLFTLNLKSISAEALLTFIRRTGIFEIITHGFNFRGTSEELEELVLGELTQELENPALYFSMHPELPGQVGALLIIGEAVYPSTTERTSKLWRSILEVEPKLKYIRGGQLRAVEIGGIFISPTNPNRGPEGDARKLLRNTIALLEPHFVIGATRSRSAMRNREEALGPIGYVHSMGTFLLSEGVGEEMRPILSAAERGFTPLHGEDWGDNGIVCLDPDYLSASPISGEDKSHPRYGVVMTAIEQAQLEMGEGCTAAVIVVSAQNDLHLQIIPESYT